MWWVGCGTNQGAHDVIKKKASNCKVLVSFIEILIIFVLFAA